MHAQNVPYHNLKSILFDDQYKNRFSLEFGYINIVSYVFYDFKGAISKVIIMTL